MMGHNWLTPNHFEQGLAEGYTEKMIEQFGLPCRCGGLVMPLFDTWLDTRQGRAVKVHGASCCRCLECLEDSPCDDSFDYIEYL